MKKPRLLNPSLLEMTKVRRMTRKVMQATSTHVSIYIHASDHPSQIFVNEPLNDGNYGEWTVDMSSALYAKNKIGFVDGTIPMPGVDSPNLAYWMRCNAMVKG